MFTRQQVRFDAGETYGGFRHMHLKSINVGIDMHVTLRPQRVAASGARVRSLIWRFLYSLSLGYFASLKSQVI